MIEPRFRVTEAIADRIKELRDDGMSQFAISVEIEHSQAVVSVVLANLWADPDFYRGVTAVEREKPDRDAAHVRMVARGGYGFPVVTQPLLSRLCALEYAPARLITKISVPA